MCYSKEVSLAVAIVIFILFALYYNKYIIQGRKSGKHRELLPGFTYFLLTFLFSGLHQLSEFLSILTGNEIIYKTGLFLSLWIIYFFMKGLERLFHYSFNVKYFIPIILLLGIYIFSIPMSFENTKFWVRSYSHYLWGITWLGFFFYGNLCIFYLMNKWTKLKNKPLKWLHLLVVNLSFIATLIYLLMSILSSPYGIKVFQDFPSIWCTLLVIQMPFLPLVFDYVKKHYKPKKNERMHKLSLSTQILLIINSLLLIALFLLIFFPFSDVPILPTCV